MATPLAGGYYPPVGFHFKVEFVSLGNDNDQRFQSVSGLMLSTIPNHLKRAVKTGLNINYLCVPNIPTCP
jgi:hypothetical protein